MAKLKLDSNSKLVFLGARTWNNPKNGNILTFVKLGDPQTFENHEFIVDPSKIDINQKLHGNVIPDFELGVFNNRTSLNLVGLSAS